eukprot:CAMPEP_0197652074 /NCGR_PEP_ID=MMETSP1338-20131121/34228_1 /TAXON_ID=43686 ORGANISM="Pelagodinium beii, Strain RCC1491" /NCGR_SAMPLE_ID=MMETSP1338 /ASSEMBLY_ACC=CAM_ASM_000754 /LENGTH=124 /DNA_ID=CAMNT_0043226871 /DNA_START=92 /DNA_END=466 /DNA_ORIENTATION=+
MSLEVQDPKSLKGMSSKCGSQLDEECFDITFTHDDCEELLDFDELQTKSQIQLPKEPKSSAASPLQKRLVTSVVRVYTESLAPPVQRRMAKMKLCRPLELMKAAQEAGALVAGSALRAIRSRQD